VWLCQRRLHQGHFIWPKSGEDSFSITQAQWEWLIAGWIGNVYRCCRLLIYKPD